jgi:alkyl hydroperoxide reductase 1
VAFIASNDAWVMSAWGKVNKVKDDDIVRIILTIKSFKIANIYFQLFLSDTKTFFSKNYAFQVPNTDRNGRWALIIEKDGTVSYVGHETARGVTVSHCYNNRYNYKLLRATTGFRR